METAEAATQPYGNVFDQEFDHGHRGIDRHPQSQSKPRRYFLLFFV